jgi:hypothetical protein
MLTRIVLATVLLTGCSDPFGDAQKVDTIAAWTTFVDENPKSPRLGMGQIRLEELYLADARSAKTLEAYDAYLSKFPKGRFIEDATKERREFLIEWARETDTVEAWEQYLKEYPATRSAGGREAKSRLNVAKNKDKIDLGPVKMEQVNLAEDPTGPLNGYGFYVDVTNKGTVAIEAMGLKIKYLDNAGNSVGSGTWPVVATRLPGGLPMAEGFSKPIGPGETRQWEWTDGDMPEDWSKKTAVVTTYINFVGE